MRALFPVGILRLRDPSGRSAQDDYWGFLQEAQLSEMVLAEMKKHEEVLPLAKPTMQPNEKRRPMGGDHRLVAGIGFAVGPTDPKTIRTAKK